MNYTPGDDHVASQQQPQSSASGNKLMMTPQLTRTGFMPGDDSANSGAAFVNSTPSLVTDLSFFGNPSSPFAMTPMAISSLSASPMDNSNSNAKFDQFPPRMLSVSPSFAAQQQQQQQHSRQSPNHAAGPPFDIYPPQSSQQLQGPPHLVPGPASAHSPHMNSTSAHGPQLNPVGSPMWSPVMKQQQQQQQHHAQQNQFPMWDERTNQTPQRTDFLSPANNVYLNDNFGIGSLSAERLRLAVSPPATMNPQNMSASSSFHGIPNQRLMPQSSQVPGISPQGHQVFPHHHQQQHQQLAAAANGQTSLGRRPVAPRFSGSDALDTNAALWAKTPASNANRFGSHHHNSAFVGSMSVFPSSPADLAAKSSPMPQTGILPLGSTPFSQNGIFSAHRLGKLSAQGKATAKAQLAAERRSRSANQGKRPSYTALIEEAIHSFPDNRAALCEIYHFISSKYPEFEIPDASWKNSVRHNLSLCKRFTRVERPADRPGKGDLWCINEVEVASDKSEKSRKLEDTKKGTIIDFSSDDPLSYDPAAFAPQPPHIDTRSVPTHLSSSQSTTPTTVHPLQPINTNIQAPTPSPSNESASSQKTFAKKRPALASINTNTTHISGPQSAAMILDTQASKKPRADHAGPSASFVTASTPGGADDIDVLAPPKSAPPASYDKDTEELFSKLHSANFDISAYVSNDVDLSGILDSGAQQGDLRSFLPDVENLLSTISVTDPSSSQVKGTAAELPENSSLSANSSFSINEDSFSFLSDKWANDTTVDSCLNTSSQNTKHRPSSAIPSEPNGPDSSPLASFSVLDSAPAWKRQQQPQEHESKEIFSALHDIPENSTFPYDF